MEEAERYERLNPADKMRLNSARGLNINQAFAKQGYRDRRGLRPTIQTYNLAIKMDYLAGSPILV